ncbi:MAG: glycine cleavage T C-terminal barrel domain-containing protein, partial [Candidatus Hadarchaeum sp.]
AGFKQKLCTVTIGNEEYLTLYGGEAVSIDGKVLGRLRSAGYGYTVKKNIGYVYLPTELAAVGTKLKVEVFGQHIDAEVAPDVLYDPRGERLRV